MNAAATAGSGRRDRRERLILLPPSAQRLVEHHELRGGVLLRRDILLLNLVFLPLRVDDIERVGQSAVEPFGGKRHRAPGRCEGFAQIAQALLLGCIRIDGGINFTERVEHRLSVVEQKLAAAEVGLFDRGIERAEIQ